MPLHINFGFQSLEAGRFVAIKPLNMSTAKKGKKSKGKTISLQEFNSSLDDKVPAAGQNVIYAPKKKPGQMTSWADEVDEDDYYEKERIFLPSAPRAVRGPAYDDSEIPREAPFNAHLGNLSYDINDEDVYKFFRDLDVVELRLPRDANSNRLRGFGHVEFATRQDLVDALIKNEQMLMGRPVRISLGSSTGNRGEERERRGDRPGREGGGYHQDETPDDWRSTMSAVKSDVDSFGGGGGGGGGPPQHFGGRRDRDRDDRPRDRPSRDFDRREMYSGPRPDAGGRDDFHRRDRDDRGPRDRSYEEEGPSDWRSSMKPREPPREDFVRPPIHHPSRMDMEPPFERRPREPEERRRRSSHEEEEPPMQPEPPRERKKLQLAPRTVPVPPGESTPEAGTASKIFGGAKPVDTASREREIEEKMAQVAVKPPKEQAESPQPRESRERTHDEPKPYRILKRPQSSDTSTTDPETIQPSSEFDIQNKPIIQGRRSQPLRLGGGPQEDGKAPKSIQMRPDRDRQMGTNNIGNSRGGGGPTDHHYGGQRPASSNNRGGSSSSAQYHPVPPAPGRRKSDSDEGDHEDDHGSRHDVRQQRDLTAPPAVNPWSRRPPPEHDNYRRDNHGPDRKTPDSDRNGEKEKDSHSEPEDDRDIRDTHRFIGEKTYNKDGDGDEFRRVERRGDRERDWGRDRGDRDIRNNDRDRGGNWHNSGPRRGDGGRNMDAPRRGGDGRFDDRRGDRGGDRGGLRDNRDRENNSRDNTRRGGGGGHMMDRDYRGDRNGQSNRMDRGGGGSGYNNNMDRNNMRGPRTGTRGDRSGPPMDKGPRDTRVSSGRMGSREDFYRDSEGFQELQRGPRNPPKQFEEKQPLVVAAQNKFCVLGDEDDVGSD